MPINTTWVYKEQCRVYFRVVLVITVAKEEVR